MEKFLISESERKKILQSHKNVLNLNNDVVIIEWLSPKEDYVIFLDELIDVKNKVKIGNIWENFDNFRFFLKHSFETSTNIPTTIKESVINSINKLVITESTQDYTFLKPFVKEFLLEKKSFGSWLGDQASNTWDWMKEKGEEAYQGTKDFVKTTAKGVVDFTKNIAKGEWAQAFSIIKKGILYLARKIRSAMYHPVGMVLDAILVATGIGKSVQWIPWAIIVALDIYEVVTGDFESPDEPTWMKVLFIGFDILGLVFAGATAIAARKMAQAAMGGIKTVEEAAKIVSKNSTLKSFLKSIGESLGKLPGYLEKAISWLKTKFPTAAEWIKGIVTNISSFIKKISGWLSKLGESGAKVGEGLSAAQKAKQGLKAGAKTAAVVTGLDYGIKKGTQIYQGKSDEEVAAEKNVADTFKNVTPEQWKELDDLMG